MALVGIVAHYARQGRPHFAEVLKSQTGHEINRVFTIYFPDREPMQQFFSAEPYKAIKAEFFESSVASTTLIAEYNRETQSAAKSPRQEMT